MGAIFPPIIVSTRLRIDFGQFLFLYQLLLDLDFCPGLGGPIWSQNHKVLYASNFLDGFLFGHIPLGSMVTFQFLAQFPVDHLLHKLCLDLYFFCPNLLHSLIIRLIVSSLSSHNQNL